MSDFDMLDALLVRVEAEAFAAEIHGFVCGQICVTGQADETLWKDFLDVQGEDDSLINSCYGEVTQLASETLAQMHSAEFGLQLLLPDDVVPIAIRVEALGNWCHGFLNGYGVSERQSTRGPSEECNEVLEDYTQICRLGIDNEETEDEQSLMELTEYVRVGAILIFEDLQPPLGSSGVLH
jgi:uncharacterized protein YgfB (UPF0149 family)